MWDNPRLLNLIAGILFGLAVLAFALAGLQRLLRSDFLPLREIEVTTPVKKTTSAEIEAAVRGRILGNFLGVDLAEVRSMLERLPWVRRASVRRVWPDRLEVEIEEHVALARWGDDALVNTYGERFAARTEQKLPLFVAPAGTEQQVTSSYARFSRLIAPLGTTVDRIVLTPRLAWQLRLANGINLMLGRDADAGEQRLRRFVEVYPVTLGKIQRSHEYVDLRYPNGFALRVPDLQPAVRG